MPSAQVTCPHCETPVEIQVTAVTRSRPCPNCGQSIMLQVAGRTSRLKHKALLMAPTPPTGDTPKPLVCEAATNFQGDAFERMCLDPELIRTRKQFLIGAACVCMIVVGAAVHYFTSAVHPPVKAPDLAQPGTPPPVASSLVDSAPAPQAPMPLVGTPLIQSDAPRRISFRAASEEAAKPGVDESQNVLEQFLKAPTVDEKLALVHDAVRVEPAMRTYYQSHQIGALSYSHIDRHPQGGGNFAEYRVVMRDGSRKFAAVVSTSEGPRVDWASFVALGDLEWEQMRQARPLKPVLMRVLASAGSHFTGGFSDSKKLSCVRLVPAADPSAKPVYGYVPTESDLGRQLASWLSTGGSEPVPLTVKLCYPEKGHSHDQAWIAEVVVPGWVTLVSNSAPREGE